MAIYGQLIKTPLGIPPPTTSSFSPPESEGVMKEKKDAFPQEPHHSADSARLFEGGMKGATLAAAATSTQAPFSRHSGTDEATNFSVATSPTRQRDFFDID